MSPRNIDVAQPYVPNVPSLYPFRYTPAPPIPCLPSEPPPSMIFAYCGYHPTRNKAWLMAEFDTVAKHLIHTFSHDFARFALQHDDFKVLGVVDTEQPTVEAHRTDSLIRVCIGGEKALVHHEFQTTDSDPPMPLRMAAYIGRGIEQYGLPFYSTVIYLRPDAGRNDPGYYVQERHGFRVLVQYQVIRLIELDGQRILDAGHSGLFPFAPLMQRPAGVDAEAWLRQVRKSGSAGADGRAAQGELSG